MKNGELIIYDLLKPLKEIAKEIKKLEKPKKEVTNG